MNRGMDEFRKQAKHYLDDLDLDRLIDSIDFSKVDTKRLRNIDFSEGFETARKQLEQLPRLRVAAEPPVVEQHNEGGFIGGLILGVVLGAIIALLFAPRSGKDTRDMMVQSVGDLKDKVAGEAAEVEVGLIDASGNIEEAVENALDDEPAIERNFGE